MKKAAKVEKEEFFGKLEDEIENIQRKDVLLALGDLNAQIGKLFETSSAKTTVHEHIGK